MMRPYGEDLKVYLYREPVDMRKGRNGLAALAQEAMKVDPFSGALLVYVGRRYNAVKILYWHRYGNRVIMGMPFHKQLFPCGKMPGSNQSRSHNFTRLPGSSRGERSAGEPCEQELVFEDVAMSCASFVGPPRYTRGS